MGSVPGDDGHRHPLDNDNTLSDLGTWRLALLSKCGWVAVILLNDDLLSGDRRYNHVLS
jgi:hypothetical protein